MHYAVPADVVVQPADESQSWVALWRERALDIAVLLVALAGLAAVLARPRWLGWLVGSERRLARVRLGYLAFTLGFVGWYAQGQLSIVNLTAAVQALVAGRSLAFFLQDPMTALLWAFTAVSLAAWGRGTFCGWLCPVGALQEFVGRLALALGVKRRRLRAALDARLKHAKYGVLAAIIGLAAWPGGATSAWVDRSIEIEPFKTAITLGFVRSWPYVLWAVIAIGSSAFVYKGFCRYLCPLGAGLALLGRVRRLDWIARRAECGTPCQTCRHRCDYQAIAPTGKIDYEECFQCLDCVAIHDSDTRCAPLIQRKRHRVIEIRALPATRPSGTQGAR
jgi:polyferredoxin